MICRLHIGFADKQTLKVHRAVCARTISEHKTYKSKVTKLIQEESRASYHAFIHV